MPHPAGYRGHHGGPLDDSGFSDGYSSEGYCSSTCRDRAKRRRDKIKRLEARLRLTQEDNEDKTRHINTLEEKNEGLKNKIRFLGHLQTELERCGQLVQDEKRAAAERKTVYETNIIAVQRERDNAYNISEENRVALERTKENLAAERRRSALLQTTNQNLQVEITNLNFRLGENQNLQRDYDELTRQLEEIRRKPEEKEKPRPGVKGRGKIIQKGTNGKPEWFKPH